MWFCTRINHVKLKIIWFKKFVYQQIQWLEQLSKCWLCAGWRFNRWNWLNGSLSCQFQEYLKVLSNSINFQPQIYEMERKTNSLSAWMKEKEENKWTLATVSANQMSRPVNSPIVSLVAMLFQWAFTYLNGSVSSMPFLAHVSYAYGFTIIYSMPIRGKYVRKSH